MVLQVSVSANYEIYQKVAGKWYVQSIELMKDEIEQDSKRRSERRSAWNY